jgi:hypothetical protein
MALSAAGVTSAAGAITLELQAFTLLDRDQGGGRVRVSE